MMFRMKSAQSVLAILALSTVMMTGCDSNVRREGFGGGARSPVKITLLTEGGAGGSEGGPAQDAGPKITEFGTVRGKISVDGALPGFAPILAKGEQTKDAICSEVAVPNETVVGENCANVTVELHQDMVRCINSGAREAAKESMVRHMENSRNRAIGIVIARDKTSSDG